MAGYKARRARPSGYIRERPAALALRAVVLHASARSPHAQASLVACRTFPHGISFCAALTAFLLAPHTCRRRGHDVREPRLSPIRHARKLRRRTKLRRPRRGQLRRPRCRWHGRRCHLRRCHVRPDGQRRGRGHTPVRVPGGSGRARGRATVRAILSALCCALNAGTGGAGAV